MCVFCPTEVAVIAAQLHAASNPVEVASAVQVNVQAAATAAAAAMQAKVGIHEVKQPFIERGHPYVTPL